MQTGDRQQVNEVISLYNSYLSEIDTMEVEVIRLQSRIAELKPELIRLDEVRNDLCGLNKMRSYESFEVEYRL